MDLFTMIAGVCFLALGIYLVGHSFIDSFFDRKEEMMKRIIDSERGG